MQHLDLTKYVELLERKPNTDTDPTPLVDLELTARAIKRLPYDVDPDLGLGDEAWYIQAVWREQPDGPLNICAHAFSFQSPATAERFLAKLRDSRVVTVRHVMQSPYWGPDASLGYPTRTPKLPIRKSRRN